MLHEGKCSNIHGHNYVVEVTVQGRVWEPEGMVMDFSDLKLLLKETILESHDHAIALNREDKDLIEFCVLHQFKHVLYDTDPTAEAMAGRFLTDLNSRIDEAEVPCYWVSSVTVFETPTSSATALYEEEKENNA